MTDISTFVSKHRKKDEKISLEEKINLLPWYKKPIESEAFTSKKAKDGKYYVRHKEWSERIWIGPYETKKDVKDIINSYVEISKINPLDRLAKSDDIHTIYVEDAKSFFKNS